MKKLLSLSLACLLLAGCAGPDVPDTGGDSAPQSGGAPGDVSHTAPPEAQYQVRTDWSVLGSREDGSLPPAVQERWHPEYTDRLIPGERYGTLIPYIGAACQPHYSRTDESGREQTEAAGYSAYLYGLMTAEGQVVMDPVCTSIYRLSYPLDNGEYAALPVLQLTRGDAQQGAPETGALVAVAAGDGRWTTDFLYWGCAAGPNALLAGNEAGLFLLSPGSGEVVKTWTWAEVGVDDPAVVPWLTGDAYSAVQWADGRFFLGCYGTDWDQARFLDPLTGAVTTSPAQDWYQELDRRYANLSWWMAERMADGSYTLTKGTDVRRLAPPLDMGDQLPYVAGGERVIFDNGAGRFAVTNLSGRVVLPPQEGTAAALQSDWEEGTSWLAVQSPEETQWTLYDWNGTQTAVLPAGTNSWCAALGPLVQVCGDTSSAYYRPEDGTCVYRTYFGLDPENSDPEV